MEVMNAVLPNVPAGTQSSPSAIAGTPNSPVLGKAASQETASAVGTGLEGVVPGLAINSAPAGLLFGMVLTQGVDTLAASLKMTAADAPCRRPAQISTLPTRPRLPISRRR